MISPSDPSEHALEAFAKVVANLGWDKEAERIVFAHTHQPLADVRCADRPRTRYWNTGSWIYEPDLGSRQAYARYLRYAWPGTAIVIDDEEPEPRLLELLADLNPLRRRRRPAGAAMSELLTIAVILVRAEEAWEPVLFGGLIPLVRGPRDRLDHLPRRPRQRRIRRVAGSPRRRLRVGHRG